MGLTFIASLPLVSPIGIGGLCPSVGASLGGAAVGLSCSLTGALSLNASFSATPPTVGFYLTGLELLLDPTGALTLGATLPPLYDCSFGASVSAGITLNASITANISASLNFGLPSLQALFSASMGCYAFTYTGPASGLGATLTAELASAWPDGAPSSGACEALILVAPTAAAATLLAFLDGLTTGPGLVYVAKLSALSQLSLSVKDALPQAAAALNAQLSACASIDASLKANLKVGLALPTIQATGAFVIKTTVPNLQASLNVKPPNVSACLSATAKLAASITANFGAMASLGLTLSNYGAFFGVYTYSGTGTAFGAAVTAGITDPSDVTAVVLACTDVLSFAILTGFFGGAL